MSLPPLVFEPRYWNRVWGGRALQHQFGRSIPDGLVGESWEVSAHPAHVSRVAEGPYAGRTLAELWQTHRIQLDGAHPVAWTSSPCLIDGHDRLVEHGLEAHATNQQPVNDPFPLLIKLLDCQQPLSIQVHPDDAGAALWCPGEAGKSEAWVVLAANPDSKILAGLKSGVTRDDVVAALQTGRIAECLHVLQPQVGDCIAIEPGTLHAILGPLVLLEVQPTSDATFRLYDWDRVGLDGQPRPLHIEQSLAVTDWARGPVNVQPASSARDPDGQLLTRSVSEGFENTDDLRVPRSRFGLVNTGCVPQSELLYASSQFSLNRHQLSQTFLIPKTQRVSVWLLVRGSGELRDQDGYRRSFACGETVLIPAAHADCEWIPTPSCELISAHPSNFVGASGS